MSEDLGAIKYSVIADTADLSRAEAEMDAFGQTAKKSAKDVDALGNETAAAGKKGKQGADELNKGMTSAAGAIKLAAGALAALGASIGVREIIAYSDAWQSASNQLRLVTSGTEELARVQGQLLGVANETRSSFESTANLYARLTRATSEMGLSQSELLGITTTINQSFAVSGATATEAAAAITQLSQGLAAGALRGDEFNSVAEQAPGIMRAIADSLDMTVGELRAFAAEGGITADIVVTALKEAAVSIGQDFGKSVQTFGQSMQIARNNMLEFIGGSEAVASATGKAASIIVTLSDNLDRIANIAETVAVLVGVRLAASFVTASAAMIQSGISASKATVSYNALTMVTTRTTVSQNLLAAASTRANAAMALMGGPVGGVLILAAGAYYLVDALQELRQETYRLAGDDFARQSLDVMSVSLTQAGVNIDAASEKVKLLRSELVSAKEIFGENSTEVEELNKQLDLQQNWLNLNKLRQAELSSETKTGAVVVGGYTDKTLSLIDQLENEQRALGMTAREQAMFNAELKALANGDGPDAIAVVRRLASENYDIAESQAKAKTELDAFNDSINEYIKEQKDAKDATDKQRRSIAETINALKEQSLALDMTARMAAVYQAVNQSIADGALPDEIAQIATATAQLYDKTDALRAAGDAATASAKSVADASEAATRRIEENYGRTHEFLTDTLMEFGENGQSVWEDLGDTAVTTIKRIAAELVASKILNFFSGGTGGATSGTLASILGSVSGAKSGAAPGAGGSIGSIASIVSTISKLGSAGAVAAPGGVAATMGTIAAPGGVAATMGAGAGIGGTIMGAIGAIPGWGWAAMGAAALASVLNNDDGMERTNAGLLVGNTPGAKSKYTFEADPFASGLAVTGVSRRADRADAESIIQQFRDIEGVVFASVTALGGTLSMAGKSIRALDEDARAGSVGTFFGKGSAGGDIAAQINSFVDQLADNIEGLDAALLAAVRSAGTAEEKIGILTGALDATAARASLLGQYASKGQKLADEEQAVADARDEIHRSFQKLNIAVPQSTEELYELVKTLDPLTESGADAIEMLSGLSGAIALVAAASANAAQVSAGAAATAMSKTVDFGGAPITSEFQRSLQEALNSNAWSKERDGEAVSPVPSLEQAGLAASPSAGVDAYGPQRMIDGSHATGLNRVPFNGYIAELHQGERVQTKAQADESDNGMMAGAKLEMIKTARLMYTILQRWDFDGLPQERA